MKSTSHSRFRRRQVSPVRPFSSKWMLATSDTTNGVFSASPAKRLTITTLERM